ncbi:transporter (CPA2 family) [Antricoccus suffuscus]|uniref:Transporter (CPA2 family) n=1 Tax=Antricoccus suffuscus TaxID=1629062 RepID=A0A2T1A0W3_9ACTN|nr:cation:proton antiporter [Antricoccus suffuscus]PRZ42250.1 transporter (CPA2 family) [Antricoccus suffuscus]
MEFSLSALIIVPTLAVVAPLLAGLVGRIARVHVVVFEILLGLLVGPSVLGWVPSNGFTTQIADFGLAFLFFMAGSETDFSAIKGRLAATALAGWLLSLIIGVSIGIAVGLSAVGGIIIGIALTSTALGTIMPMLRDAHEMSTPFGRAVIAVGAVGEFGPLVAISLFLSGRTTAGASVVLVAFVVISAIAVFAASRGRTASFYKLIASTLHTSTQLAVRIVVMIVAALAALSIALGLDMLLGAFTAGVICRVLLSGARPEHKELIETKLEAVSFGFLVPIFFINVGITFDLHALLSNGRALILLPIFVLFLLVVRGVPGGFAAPPGSRFADRLALVLFTATGLPIIVAVTAIGVDEKYLAPGTASALVGAGMLSVLLFPAIAMGQRSRARKAQRPHPGSG